MAPEKQPRCGSGQGKNTQMSLYSDTRPDHGALHVKFVKDLRVGSKFQMMHGLTKQGVVEILSRPKNGWVRVRITTSSGGKGRETMMSLRDRGILSHKNPTKWNRINWLAKIS